VASGSYVRRIVELVASGRRCLRRVLRCNGR
jgi:hypothetical protein